MKRAQLFKQIQKKKSFLCVGLDPDLDKMPLHLLDMEDPIFEFNKLIIDATHHLAVAYKPNAAFYEAHGPKGWESLQKTLNYIPNDIFTIIDAKRGDIGNTTNMYAKAFFEQMGFDAITLSPYMGSESVKPYLQYEDKTAIVLALTSNSGSKDFQMLKTPEKALYEEVLTTVASWGTTDNIMFVVGATHPEMFQGIRKLVPDHFLLVPGVGAQGGDLEALCHHGLNNHCGLLVNSARGIIYAGGRGADFIDGVSKATNTIQQQMAHILHENGLLG